MCSVVVKAPNDLLTRRPFLSGRMTSSYGHGVNGFLDKFIGHRTNRHSTFDKFWTPFIFFTAPMTAGEWISRQNRRRFRRHPMMRRLLIREELTIAIAKVLADNGLDAIVHKTVEHQPTYIKDGINPPYVNNKGIPALNTFLVFAATMTVPSGFTNDNLPVGITFLGPAYSEPTLLKLAYAYEQATHHRMPPKTAPALP